MTSKQPAQAQAQTQTQAKAKTNTSTSLSPSTLAPTKRGKARVSIPQYQQLRANVVAHIAKSVENEANRCQHQQQQQHRSHSHSQGHSTNAGSSNKGSSSSAPSPQQLNASNNAATKKRLNRLLQCAAAFGCQVEVVTLLNLGADPWNHGSSSISGGSGWTAFHYAASCGQITTLALIASHPSVQASSATISTALCSLPVIPSELLHYTSHPALSAMSPFDMVAYLFRQLMARPPILDAYNMGLYGPSYHSSSSSLFFPSKSHHHKVNQHHRYPHTHGRPATFSSTIGRETLQSLSDEDDDDGDSGNEGMEYNEDVDYDDDDDDDDEEEDSDEALQFGDHGPHRLRHGPRRKRYSGAKKLGLSPLPRKNIIFSGGDASNFALGHGDQASRALPVRIKTLEHHDVISVACSQYVSAAVTSDGGLWTWGFGSSGRLGHPSSQNSELVPKRHFSHPASCIHVIGSPTSLPLSQPQPQQQEETDSRIKFQYVAVSSLHGAAIAQDGTLWTWGRCKEGQLGLGDKTELIALIPAGGGDTSTTSSSLSPPEHLPLMQVKWTKGNHMVQVACGEFHTVSISVDGNVWVMGSNQHGQLGIGPPPLKDEWMPRQLSSLANVHATMVACGSRHTVIGTDTNDVYVTGFGNHSPRRIIFSFGYPSVLSMKSTRAGNLATQRFSLKQLATTSTSTATNSTNVEQILILTHQNELYEYVESHESHPRKVILCTRDYEAQPPSTSSPTTSRRVGSFTSTSASASSSFPPHYYNEVVGISADDDDSTSGDSDGPPIPSCWQPYITKIACTESFNYCITDAGVVLKWPAGTAFGGSGRRREGGGGGGGDGNDNRHHQQQFSTSPMKSPSYHHHHHHRHAGKSQDADTDTDVDETRVVAERVPIGAQRATNIAVSKAHMLMLMQGPAKPPAPSGNYYSDSAATASSSTLTFPQQLLSMLLNEVHTDVIVRVVRRNHHHQPQEEEELGRIKAHRFMLSRCPALRILLDTATRDTVTLESHSLSAAQVVLQYLYTDSIDITLPINNNKNTATSPSIATSNTHVKFVAFHPRLHHDDVLILAEYLCISPLVKLLKNGRLRGSAATANATAPPANTAPVSPPSGRTSQAWVPLTHWLESLFISPLQTQCISSGSNGDTVILRPTASSTTTTATTTTTGVDQQQLSSPVGMDCRASAHRALLIARSDYFDTMLCGIGGGGRGGGWIEADRHTIELGALSAEALHFLVRYIYTDTLTSGDSSTSPTRKMTNVLLTYTTAVELLGLADEMLLYHLKHLVQTHLTQHLKPENASQLLVAALTYDAPSLQRYAKQYIANNLELLLRLNSLSDIWVGAIPFLGRPSYDGGKRDDDAASKPAGDSTTCVPVLSPNLEREWWLKLVSAVQDAVDKRLVSTNHFLDFVVDHSQLALLLRPVMPPPPPLPSSLSLSPSSSAVTTSPTDQSNSEDDDANSDVEPKDTIAPPSTLKVSTNTPKEDKGRDEREVSVPVSGAVQKHPSTPILMSDSSTTTPVTMPPPSPWSSATMAHDSTAQQQQQQPKKASLADVLAEQEKEAAMLKAKKKSSSVRRTGPVWGGSGVGSTPLSTSLAPSSSSFSNASSPQPSQPRVVSVPIVAETSTPVANKPNWPSLDQCQQASASSNDRQHHPRPTSNIHNNNNNNRQQRRDRAARNGGNVTMTTTPTAAPISVSEFPSLSSSSATTQPNTTPNKLAGSVSSFATIQAEQQRTLDRQRQKALPMKDIIEQEALLDEHRRVEEYYESLKKEKEALAKALLASTTTTTTPAQHHRSHSAQQKHRGGRGAGGGGGGKRNQQQQQQPSSNTTPK